MLFNIQDKRFVVFSKRSPLLPAPFRYKMQILFDVFLCYSLSYIEIIMRTCFVICEICIEYDGFMNKGVRIVTLLNTSSLGTQMFQQ